MAEANETERGSGIRGRCGLLLSGPPAVRGGPLQPLVHSCLTATLLRRCSALNDPRLFLNSKFSGDGPQSPRLDEPRFLGAFCAVHESPHGRAQLRNGAVDPDRTFEQSVTAFLVASPPFQSPDCRVRVLYHFATKFSRRRWHPQKAVTLSPRRFCRTRACVPKNRITRTPVAEVAGGLKS